MIAGGENQDTPVRQSPLAEQVLNLLSYRISSRFYRPDSRLPGEIQLASELGVSRATIRRAMDLLVTRGLVHRQQGVGTFVASLQLIPNPLEQFVDFCDIIRDAGLEPGLIHLEAKLESSDQDIASILELGIGERVLTVHKVFTANDEPVVFCLNHIPAWVLEPIRPETQALEPNYTEPILEFFHHRCGQQLDYYISSIKPELAGQCEIREIEQALGANSPVLVVDEIGYNTDDRPVHHSVEYHPTNRMDFSLLRFVGPKALIDQNRTRERAFQRCNQGKTPRIIFHS